MVFPVFPSLSFRAFQDGRRSAVRAHFLREEFQRFWQYASPTWAGKFLDSWCTGALRRHRPLILNWFHALGMISTGVVEGFNGKAKLTTRKAYGFRIPQGIEFALFHVMWLPRAGMCPQILLRRPKQGHAFSD